MDSSDSLQIDEHLARLLAAPERSQAGRTAPARGLFLMKVDY